MSNQNILLDYHNFKLFPFNIPELSEFPGGAWPLLGYLLNSCLDYGQSNLVHQTQNQGMYCSEDHRV